MITVSRETVRDICDAINVQRDRVQEQYVGVSNASTHLPAFGLVLASINEAFAFMAGLGQLSPPDAYWLARHARIDHVDTEIVLYFPGARIGE